MADPTEQAPAADGVSEVAAAAPPVATARGFRLLGEDRSVHTALGGGKTADILLWKDKKMSSAVIGGATFIWILFEVVEYNFLPLVSHVLIGVLAIVFLWSKATALIKKSPPNIPEVHISEELAANIMSVMRADINQALGLLREIALGHDLMKFLGMIVALWILSEIGSLCDFLTLIYAAALMLHTVPILYHKYQDEVDYFAGKAHVELGKQYEVFDAKVLSKIPRGPVRAEKQD